MDNTDKLEKANAEISKLKSTVESLINVVLLCRKELADWNAGMSSSPAQLEIYRVLGKQDEFDTAVIDPETYVFNFGKYVGTPYEIVRDSDPTYILECYLDIDWFNIPVEEIEFLEDLEEYDDADTHRPLEDDEFQDWYDDPGYY